MTAGLIDALLGLYDVDHSEINHTNQVRSYGSNVIQLYLKLRFESEAYHRLVFNKTSCEIFIHI